MAIKGLLGKKLGMVQVILDDGRALGCTAVELGPCAVTQIMQPGRNGYQAVQLGFERVPDWRLTKPERGHTGSNGALRHLAEFEADAADYESLTVGQTVTVTEVFQVGDRVDAQGITKGKGFAGPVKRHGFSGGPRTHGQSDRHRAPGSIGAGTTPGRVFKGTRMAGRLGGKRESVRNLEIVKIHPERGLVFIRGGVPGAPQGIVKIRQTTRVVRVAAQG